MTDNEIIMGLTQCIGVDGSCRVCPYWDKCEYENNDVMLKDVWDLINRKQAEIERLKGDLLFREKQLDNLVKEKDGE